MAGEIFFIGDTHFGHKRILEFGNRPYKTIEEHDDAMIALWNSVVDKRDVVYHLGDVAFTKSKLEKIAACNGIKKLIMGNHDLLQVEIYKQYFSKVYGALKWHEYLLTHIPIHPTELSYRAKWNIHGHLHGYKLGIPYLNANADQIGLTPLTVEDLKLKNL